MIPKITAVGEKAAIIRESTGTATDLFSWGWLLLWDLNCAQSTFPWLKWVARGCNYISL